jgi:hypothetical protein
VPQLENRPPRLKIPKLEEIGENEMVNEISNPISLL